MERVTAVEEFFQAFFFFLQWGGTTVTGRRKYSADLAQNINKRSHLLQLPRFVLFTPSLNSRKCEHRA